MRAGSQAVFRPAEGDEDDHAAEGVDGAAAAEHAEDDDGGVADR